MEQTDIPNKVPLFHCVSPCNNCPYRTDAPLKLWDKHEFERLLENENDHMGSVYMCHKKNGSACIGWLMKQDEQNFPSISLRLSLLKNKVTREYLDRLSSPAKLYKNVRAMIKANFPEILKNK